MLFYVRILTLMLAIPLAGATTVPALYVVDLPIEAGTVDQTPAWLQASFVEVVQRITGQPGAGQLPALQKARQAPERYVGRTAKMAINGGETVFRVVYDPKRLNQMIQTAGLPIWGTDRPLTVAWLVLDTPSERHLVGPETQPDWPLQLHALAQRLGLVVVLPTLDLDDVNAVSVEAAWAAEQAPLESASQRYGAEAVLVGRLSTRDDTVWDSDWVVFVGDERLHWHDAGPSVERLLTTGMTGLAERLAERSAVYSDQNAADLIVMVEGIGSIADYANLLSRLKASPAVAALRVIEVQGSQAQFLIKPIGGEGAFKQAMALEQQVTYLASETGVLRYQWVKE